MFKSAKLLIPVVALALVIAGCSSEKTPMQSTQNLAALSGAFELPAGATLESASFNVFVGNPSGQHVNVHGITADWAEMTVTWNSFDSAFDAAVYGGFTNTTVDWYSVDVTTLVGEWLAGTYPNYGILLNQDALEWPRSLYFSKEFGENPAYLHICYELNGQSQCVDVTVDMDTYILENEGNANYGAVEFVYTGRYAEAEPNKWALFWFDLTQDEPELACIGDRVWYDSNCDGIQDEGELGAAGITVHLMDCEGGILGETTTDAMGNYLFCDLMPGSYKIHFVLPTGYYAAPMDQGMNDAMDSDADATGLTMCTELVGGETDLTWDLGLCMEMETGCTRTPGYWKTHAGFGPQADVVTQYLPIWLGTGAGKSVQVTDAAMAVAILDYKYAEAKASNGILKLYRNLLAAKLNVAAGTSGAALGTAVADADAFLAMFNSADWASLSRQNRAKVLNWASLFDQYNNGCIGPGHCESDAFGEDCGDDSN